MPIAQHRFARRWAARLTAFALVAASIVATQLTPAAAPKAAAATGGARPHLLLIHGYTDNCTTAFQTPGTYDIYTDTGTTPTVQQNDKTTEDFLTGPNGGGWTTGDITTVGYYTSSDSWSDTTVGGCGVNLNQLAAEHSPAAGDAAKCDALGTAGNNGTVNDPIPRLGCLFAWYIYDTYTVNGIPVEIVAHSMGGLITREAIGGSNGFADFPSSPLLVPRVVTVASPLGGVDAFIADASWIGGQGSDEIGEMKQGSAVMNQFAAAAFEKPQGAGGTFWGLIGASTPTGPSDESQYSQAQSCGALGVGIPTSWSLARAVSCMAANYDSQTTLYQYPDGDSTVQAISMMSMKADTKILYGTVEDWVNARVYVSDPTGSLEYEHETQTCQQARQGIPTPPRLCTQAPFYLNDATLGTGATAFVCTSACNSTSDFNDLNLAHPVGGQRHSLAEIAFLLVPPLPPASPWRTGHAAHAGDDYPYETLGQFGHSSEGTDAWNEFYGQCDSFAAWKVYENLAGAAAQPPPGSIPAAGWTPSNAGISPVNQFTWGPNGGKYGNADVWASKFASLGYAVDGIPAPGAIAYWPNAVTDPQDGNPPNPMDGLGSFGHVGYVTDVYPDGSVNVESYNMRDNGEYSVVHFKYLESYTDNSFGLGNISIPWPAAFIHVADGAANQNYPTEPTDPGVVFAGYPGTTGTYNAQNGQPGLVIAGPNDGANDFSLAGSAYPGTVHGWYSDAGHGEVGQMLWTNTHKGAADSTATWNPALTAAACYRVDAFVPDNWSNNDAALYTVVDQYFGRTMVPVDENQTTNDWVELGVFKADNTSGRLPVTLTDQGSGTGQVAADALRYIEQPDCNGVVRTSQTATYNDRLALSGSGWTLDSGRGQLGDSYYVSTGTSAGATANWSVYVTPNACYEIMAYVPDGHSDSYQAQYTVHAADGTPNVSVDENAYTNNFASLGTYRADGSGFLEVVLNNTDTTTANFVAADTMSFVNIACPAALQGATYPAGTIGPASGLPGFSLGSDWYNRFGHGDLGYEKWTNTHGSTPVSTATWSFTGLASLTCYNLSAFIPDNYANNPNANYQIQTATGGPYPATINQNTATGWTYLAHIATGRGTTMTVTLDDTGPTGTYTAADAISVTQAAC